MAEPDTAAPKTLAEKLDYLFQVVHPAGRGEYTYREVAATIQRGGPSISSSYLWQLRSGLKDNPTKKHIEALAKFFGVPAAYFFDDEKAEQVDAQLGVLNAMRDAGVRQVALRAADLSPESLGVIRSMIERTRELEGRVGRAPPRDNDGPDQRETP
jgi:transcriptional regulator with XRE-family HTH domain